MSFQILGSISFLPMKQDGGFPDPDLNACEDPTIQQNLNNLMNTREVRLAFERLSEAFQRPFLVQGISEHTDSNELVQLVNAFKKMEGFKQQAIDNLKEIEESLKGLDKPLQGQAEDDAAFEALVDQSEADAKMIARGLQVKTMEKLKGAIEEYSWLKRDLELEVAFMDSGA